MAGPLRDTKLSYSYYHLFNKTEVRLQRYEQGLKLGMLFCYEEGHLTPLRHTYEYVSFATDRPRARNHLYHVVRVDIVYNYTMRVK